MIFGLLSVLMGYTKSASYTPFSTSAANFFPSPPLLENKGVIKTDLVLFLLSMH